MHYADIVASLIPKVGYLHKHKTKYCYLPWHIWLKVHAVLFFIKMVVLYVVSSKLAADSSAKVYWHPRAVSLICAFIK